MVPYKAQIVHKETYHKLHKLSSKFIFIIGTQYQTAQSITISYLSSSICLHIYYNILTGLVFALMSYRSYERAILRNTILEFNYSIQKWLASLTTQGWWVIVSMNCAH